MMPIPMLTLVPIPMLMLSLFAAPHLPAPNAFSSGSRSIVFYFTKTVFPQHLAALYEIPPSPDGNLILPIVSTLAACAILGLWVAVLLVRLLRPARGAPILALETLATRWRFAMAATGAFVVMLSPTLAVIGPTVSALDSDLPHSASPHCFFRPLIAHSTAGRRRAPTAIATSPPRWWHLC